MKNSTGSPINFLNELEIINTGDSIESKFLFANIWQTSLIYMIDLDTGIAVTKWDLEELLQKQQAHLEYFGSQEYWQNAYLNGIAYFEENDTFILTGKEWDFIFEVDLNYQKFVE